MTRIRWAGGLWPPSGAAGGSVSWQLLPRRSTPPSTCCATLRSRSRQRTSTSRRCWGRGLRGDELRRRSEARRAQSRRGPHGARSGRGRGRARTGVHGWSPVSAREPCPSRCCRPGSGMARLASVLAQPVAAAGSSPPGSPPDVKGPVGASARVVVNGSGPPGRAALRSYRPGHMHGGLCAEECDHRAAGQHPDRRPPIAGHVLRRERRTAVVAARVLDDHGVQCGEPSGTTKPPTAETRARVRSEPSTHGRAMNVAPSTVQGTTIVGTRGRRVHQRGCLPIRRANRCRSRPSRPRPAVPAGPSRRRGWRGPARTRTTRTSRPAAIAMPSATTGWARRTSLARRGTR